MKHLDLFSGIGGAALAVDSVWGGSEHIFCDNQAFAQKVLKKHWPQSKIYDDVRKIKGTELGKIDIITGGFPCQPFSESNRNKNRKRGKEDDRYLWPEMFRIISETKPTWVIGENVVGFIEMALETVCADLESIGYEVRAFIIPACAIGAPHKRNRVWIIANAQGKRWVTVDEKQKDGLPAEHYESFDAFWGLCSELSLVMEPDFTNPSIGVERNDDGISEGMDRLHGAGNAWQPQVAIEIMRAIKEVDL